jgi:hypothetical protein
MRKLTITSVAVGAALLSAAPFSLRFSPENSVSLAIDTANAVIGRPLTPLSIAGVHRRAMRRGSYGYGGGYYPYRSYGYGYESYSAYQSNTYGYHSYRITGSWNSYSSTWYSPYRANGGYSSPAYNPWSAYGSTAYSPFPWGGYSSAAYNPY